MMPAFACGRCEECDGGRGAQFCVSPRGGRTMSRELEVATLVRDACAAAVATRVMEMYARGASCDPQRAELRNAAAAIEAIDLDALLKEET